VIPLEDLIPYINNSRTHSEEQVNQIASSIKEFGFLNPVIIDEDNGLIAGHGRVMAAKKLGMEEVPFVRAEGLTEAQKKAYVIADNQLALNADWDLDKLKLEVDNLIELDFDTDLLGFSDDFISDLLDDDEYLEASENTSTIKEYFGIPPFTVINAREGSWQERKRFWLKKGIESELGRDANTFNISEWMKEKGKTGGDTNQSIFDPVLCEIMYKWFSKEGAVILDPFAGGSVRGVVASICNRFYIGNDISEKQIKENRRQSENICVESKFPPVWTIGDSKNICSLTDSVQADMMFSCPPYYNLEIYSDDANDISNMSYDDFLFSYRKIISECFLLLKENSFAVWVIGDVRCKQGNYINFLGDTISAFIDAGFRYYNEAVYVGCIGSASLRASRPMKTSRKLCKVHQNILVFVKGDANSAAKKCGDIEINISEELTNTYGEGN